MRLWITGFGPFPGAPVNPTVRLVEHLARLGAAGLGASELHTEILPTEFARAPRLVAEGHGRIEPDIAVHFGLAAGARTMRLEQRAANEVTPGRADATGAVAQCAHVDGDGPPDRRSAWPAAVIEAVSAAGLPAELSDDAGRYVCNAVYYRSLACAAVRPGVAAWFVHVPHTHESAAAAGASPPADAAVIAEAELSSAAVAIVRTLVSAARSGRERRP